MNLSRKVAVIASLAVAGLVLTACSNDDEAPVETAVDGPVESGAPTPTPTAAPEFHPDGGAEENHAFFDLTLEGLLAENESAGSHEMVDTLAAAGFDKSRMEVTFDRTSADLEADFVIVSVKMPDEMCLIGQFGLRGYTSMVAEPMSTGKCLIGKTQEIDW